MSNSMLSARKKKPSFLDDIRSSKHAASDARVVSNEPA